MDFLLLGFRLILCAVFLLAAIGKLLDRNGSEKAVREFDVPEPLVVPVVFVLPWLELAIAVSFVFVQTSWIGAFAGLVLLIIFMLGMLLQIKKGNAPDCHCFGQIHSEPISRKSVIRNILFSVPALLLMVSGREVQGTDLFGSRSEVLIGNYMQAILGLAVVGFLVAIVFLLKKISEQQNLILRRIEILELVSSEGREISHEGLESSNGGFPIGTPVPAFEVTDSEGRQVMSRTIFGGGRPKLLLFVSPSCHPCESLLSEINEWIEEFKEKLDIVFISSGRISENLEKFGEQHSKRLYLQQDREISELLGARWTPTGLVFDADGLIISHVVVGDAAIRKLVGKIRLADLGAEYLYFANGSADSHPLIGMQVPEFELDDLAGNRFSSTGFLGKRTLATFWSTTCPFCIEMIEALREWDNTKGADEPDLVVFSSGDPAQHSGIELASPILIDDEYETSKNMGMDGTPSAVLIDAKGRITSETGVGASQIWALLGKYRPLDDEKG